MAGSPRALDQDGIVASQAPQVVDKPVWLPLCGSAAKADERRTFPRCLPEMRIMKNKTPFQARGQVAYSSGGMGMGVRFTALDPDQILLLEK
jgi:hypothetical protein